MLDITIKLKIYLSLFNVIHTLIASCFVVAEAFVNWISFAPFKVILYSTHKLCRKSENYCWIILIGVYATRYICVYSECADV